MSFILAMGTILATILAFSLHAKAEPLWGVAAILAVLFLCALGMRAVQSVVETHSIRKPMAYTKLRR